jgi:hypothetical protein
VRYSLKRSLGWVVQSHIEEGEGDDGFRIVVKPLFCGDCGITLCKLVFPDMRDNILVLMIRQELLEEFFIAVGAL